MLALQGPAALSLLTPLCEGYDPLAAAPFTFAEARVAGVAVHRRAHRLHGRARRRADLRRERGRRALGRAARGRRRALRPGRARCPAPRGLLPAARQRHHAGHERDRGRPRLGLRGRTRTTSAPTCSRRTRAEGPQRKLVALRMDEERAVPRPGCPIVDGDDVVGEVTSGTFSPTLQRGIGLGYVPAALAAPGHRHRRRRARTHAHGATPRASRCTRRRADRCQLPRAIPTTCATTASTTGRAWTATSRRSA